MHVHVRVQVEEEYALRMEPLGTDRRHNRYWRFPASWSAPAHADTHTAAGPAGMPLVGRLWVELAPPESAGPDVRSEWRLLTAGSQLEALKGCLDPRGAREGALYAALLRMEEPLRRNMPAGEARRGAAGPGAEGMWACSVGDRMHTCWWRRGPLVEAEFRHLTLQLFGSLLGRWMSTTL